MTVKQKFEKIDQSKLAQAQVDILKMMADKTDNFKTKDKETLEKIDASLDKIIAKLQESNPDALKSTARKTSTAGKAKAKTTSASTTGGKNNVMALAKKIRKPNESWPEAQKRAKASLQGDIKQASKVVTSELQKLKAFINRRKQLKGIAGTDLLRDATRKAKPRGSRKSKEGNVYYEYRENRTDRLAPNYPKNAPLLAGGGGIRSQSEINKIISEKEKMVKNLTPKEISEMWNKNSYGVNKGISKPMTIEEAKNPNMRFYLKNLLIENELSEKEYDKYFADGGGVDGIEEDIDMTDDYVLRVNKGVEPKDRASMREFIAKTNESREAMTYELGGAFMQTDLAGNTGGGTAGLNAKMALSGVSGTHYTGLVGETGALSSGEMFARGGSTDHKYLNHSQDYEVRYAKGRNRHGYGNLKFDDGGVVDYSKQTSDDFKLGEIVWDVDNKRYGTIIGIYNQYPSDKYEIRLDSDGMQPTENLRKVGSKGDKGKKEQLDEAINSYARLRKDYPKNNYPKQMQSIMAYGGAVMANQQIIDDASQHYVNYYLNDGASAGMFKNGGAIKNQYAGRTSEDIWNNLSKGQRSHFLYDHMDEIQEYKDIDRFSTSQIRVAINSDWMFLDKDIKNRFSNHVREGQYATGGMMPKPSTSKHRNE